MIYRFTGLLNLIINKDINLIKAALANEIFWLIVLIFFLNMLKSIGGHDDTDID